MRTFPYRLCLAAIAVMMLSVSFANAETGSVTVKVPFAFLVGEKTLPAGAYSVEFEPIIHRVVIRPVGGGPAVHAWTTPAPRPGVPDGAELVFHKYDRTLVLWRAVQPGSREYSELSRSKAERDMEKNAAAPSTLVALRAR